MRPRLRTRAAQVLALEQLQCSAPALTSGKIVVRWLAQSSMLGTWPAGGAGRRGAAGQRVCAEPRDGSLRRNRGHTAWHSSLLTGKQPPNTWQRCQPALPTTAHQHGSTAPTRQRCQLALHMHNQHTPWCSTALPKPSCRPAHPPGSAASLPFMKSLQLWPSALMYCPSRYTKYMGTSMA